MQSVPLRVSCPSPMCRLAGLQGGARPGPFLHLSPVPGSGSYAPSRADLCVRGGPAGRGAGGCGGRSLCRPASGAWFGGARGAGGSGSLRIGLSLYLPWAGTKAGFIDAAQSMEVVVSILLRFVSVRCRLDAVRGVPLRASAGLQACLGHCGSGRVTVWGGAAYGPSGAPPQVPRPSRRGGGLPWPSGGGLLGRRPLGQPQAVRGLEGGGGRIRGGGCARVARRPPSVLC